MRNILILLLTLVHGCNFKNMQNIPHKNFIVSVKEFEQNYNPTKDILLDVRTTEEYKKGYIKNAKNIDVLKEKEFIESIESLDKHKKIYLYCRSGNRSVKATEILLNHGFKDVKDIEGGYQHYKKIKKSSAAPK